MSYAAEGQWYHLRSQFELHPPLRVVDPESCQAIRRAEGRGAADQGEHTLHPDAVPVRCPAEEGLVHLSERDLIPCPSYSSLLC